MLILNLIITIAAYMVYPTVKFKLLKQKEYTNQEIKKTCIWNSVIVQLLFLLIGTSLSENYEPNFTPAIIYYFINLSLFQYKENKIINKYSSEQIRLAIVLSVVCIIIVSILIHTYSYIFIK